MERLKPRQRVDNLVSEKRKPKKSYGRHIYLGLLGLIAIATLDLAFGHLLYLDADGLVMQRSYDVATEHRGTVIELLVEEGSSVEKDQLVARVQSRDVLEQLASLRAQRLEAERDLYTMRARRLFLLAIRDAARERAEILEHTLESTQTAMNRGLANARNLSNAYDDAFDGMQDAQRIVADAAVIHDSIRLLEINLRDLSAALDILEKAYRNGEVRAIEAGLIADLDVIRGTVISPGESLMQVFYDEPFVLAEVPTGTAFNLRVDDWVTIQSGVESYRGQIEYIYPVASRLSEEFQRTFEPTHRRQLVRITFEDYDHRLALFTKVHISASMIGRLFESMTGWIL